MKTDSTNPRVSVLIPNYNYGRFLREALDSVLAQTYQDFEIVVVDNCSTDNSEEVVGGYISKDPRVRFVKNQTNIGMFRNYNQCLLEARGKYIKFLNADDKLHINSLEKLVHILDTRENVSLVTSHRQCFGDKDDILKSEFTGLIPGKEAILKGLLRGNFIGEPTTVMFRRQNLNLGLFDISIVHFSDYDMWLKQLQTGDLYVIDEILSYFRIHGEQETVVSYQSADKKIFNRLQFYMYQRSALLMNRFGYDYTDDNPKEVKEILKVGQRRMYKYLFFSTVHRLKIRYFITSFKILLHVKFFFKRLFGLRIMRP